MSTRKQGDKCIMYEHLIVVKDEDSLDQQAVTWVSIYGEPDPKKTAEYSEIVDKAIEYAKKSNQNVLAMNGNSLEYEYEGLTGRTVECELVPVERLAWRQVKELTPSKVDIGDYFKIG